MVWAPHEIVRVWLDAMGAVNLSTGKPHPTTDPVLVAAGKLIADEEYNGLSTGHGRDVIVQLVREFAEKGYPAEVEPWQRAYFAAGGTFRHSSDVGKIVADIKGGTKHRVQRRYVDDIVDVLAARVSESS